MTDRHYKKSIKRNAVLHIPHTFKEKRNIYI